MWYVVCGAERLGAGEETFASLGRRFSASLPSAYCPGFFSSHQHAWRRSRPLDAWAFAGGRQYADKTKSREETPHATYHLPPTTYHIPYSNA